MVETLTLHGAGPEGPEVTSPARGTVGGGRPGPTEPLPGTSPPRRMGRWMCVVFPTDALSQMVLLSYDPITGTTDGRHFPPLPVGSSLPPTGDEAWGREMDGGGEGKPPPPPPIPYRRGSENETKERGGRLNLERLLTIFVYVPGGRWGKK